MYYPKNTLAQSIIGKKINDTVSTSIENEEQWTILSIERWLDSNCNHRPQWFLLFAYL